MKKIFITFVFLVTLSLGQKAFADCKITTVPTQDKIRAHIANCPALSGTEVYRVAFSTKPVKSLVPSDYIYGGTAAYQLSDPKKDTEFDVIFDAAYYKEVYKYFYIYKFPNSTEKDKTKATQAMGEVQYSAPISFRPLSVSPRLANGNITVTGGLTLPSGKTGIRYVIQYTTDKANYSANPAPSLEFVEGTTNMSNEGVYNNEVFGILKNPADTVYLRQVYYDTSGKAVSDTNIVSTTSTYGTNIKAQTTDTDKHSYTLLADDKIKVWDINSLMCVEYNKLTDKEKSELPKSQQLNCSFSDILNYVIKIAIGFAVVALVLRIMYEGFIYMTTDSIGMKSSVKTSIMDMAIGLVIALTSWIILNTINPTLVNNTLSVDKVKIEFQHYDINGNNYLHHSGSGAAAGQKAKPRDFPATKKDQEALTRAAIKEYGLASLTVQDASKWFPGAKNTLTEDQWVKLFAGIIEVESNFNPKNSFIEDFNDSVTKRNAISEGLMQLSVGDCPGYGFGTCTTAQLQDPQFNLRLGAAIMKQLITKKSAIESYISGPGKIDNAEWGGAARYWSSVRK